MDKNKEKEQKAPLFYSPFKRILIALAPLILVSLAASFIVKALGLLVSPVVISLAAFGVYLVIQIIDLRLFIVMAPGRNEYVATNILAYAVTTVFSIGALILLLVIFGVDRGGVLFTWMFMPVKVFYYAGVTGRLFSALFAGIIALLIALVFPIFFPAPYILPKAAIEQKAEHQES